MADSFDLRLETCGFGTRFEVRDDCGDGREVWPVVLKARPAVVLGFDLLLVLDRSLTVEVPKTERRSIVAMLLFLVGDLNPGGSTMDTLFLDP